MTVPMRGALQRIARDDRGNVATLAAFSLLPLIILMAGVINFGIAYMMRNELQYTADASALAGASQLGNDSDVVSKANEFAETNMPAAAQGAGDVLVDADIEIGNWDRPTRTFTAGASPENAVRTTTRRTEANGNAVPTFLGNLIGISSWDLATSAVATQVTEFDGCLLALDPTANGAFKMTGSASLTLNGCGAMSNSTSNTGFSITGSAAATMTCALGAGGVEIQKVSGLTLTECDETLPSSKPAADPYEDLPEPPVTGPCKSLPNGQGAATITPGRFCGGGSLKGVKTFQPGMYVMDGGTMQISAQANITGSGVTFFMTNNAKVDMNANGNMTLSAPTSGTYEGILFFGDKDNTNNTNLFNGGPTSSLTGALYFPNQTVDYRGNFTGVNGCMRIVARIIDFRGNVTMSVTCPNLPPFPLKTKISLVN